MKGRKSNLGKKPRKQQQGDVHSNSCWKGQIYRFPMKHAISRYLLRDIRGNIDLYNHARTHPYVPWAQQRSPTVIHLFVFQVGVYSSVYVLIIVKIGLQMN